MLVLSRKENESVVIGKDIILTVLSIEPGRIRLGFTAPTSISIHRKEVLDKILEEQKEQEQEKENPVV